MNITRNIGISVILTLVLKATLVTCFCVCCLHDIGVKIQLHTEGANCPAAQHQTNAEHCSSSDCNTCVANTSIPLFVQKQVISHIVKHVSHSFGFILTKGATAFFTLINTPRALLWELELSRPIAHRFFTSAWQWSS